MTRRTAVQQELHVYPNLALEVFLTYQQQLLGTDGLILNCAPKEEKKGPTWCSEDALGQV